MLRYSTFYLVFQKNNLFLQSSGFIVCSPEKNKHIIVRCFLLINLNRVKFLHKNLIVKVQRLLYIVRNRKPTTSVL